ncbi:hypothetical protein [Isoptericola sp. G70]|uniref:hypothetical protein n=1 Tax=Isoptericola sp. G70 TaxID=3376633 RepID=UPI003A80948A
MRYMGDGRPEFDPSAERWRRPLWVLSALVMAALLWATAAGAGLLDQAAVLTPLAPAGAVLAFLMGRVTADTLLRR